MLVSASGARHETVRGTSSPGKDSSLIFAAILHKEAGRVLRVARRMVARNLDVLSNLE